MPNLAAGIIKRCSSQRHLFCVFTINVIFLGVVLQIYAAFLITQLPKKLKLSPTLLKNASTEDFNKKTICYHRLTKKGNEIISISPLSPCNPHKKLQLVSDFGNISVTSLKCNRTKREPLLFRMTSLYLALC